MIWLVLAVAWVALTIGFVLGCRWIQACRRWDAESPVLPPGYLQPTPRGSQLGAPAGR